VGCGAAREIPGFEAWWRQFGSTAIGMLSYPFPSYVLCRSCSEPIDVWEPPGFRMGPDPETGRHVLTRVDPSQALCPECRILASDPEDRSSLEALHQTFRRVRRAADIPVFGTLYVLHIIGSHTILRSDDYVLNLYAVKVGEWDDSKPQPLARFTPDDPSEPPFVFVFVGAEVSYAPTPRSSLQLSWSFVEQDRPGRMKVLGWDDPHLTRGDFAGLCRGAEIFQALIGAGWGRPPRSFRRDRNWYLDRFRAQARTLRRAPTQAEFSEEFGVPVSTMRRNLTAFGLWPWKVFVQHASGTRPRRV
jgi:hypothetical protein